MTREEAIAVLEAIRQFTMAHYPWSKEDNEAIDMAIEALQAPTDGDLIRREDVIAICHDGYVSNAYDIAEKIKALPSADRPHGEWVEPQLIYTDAHKVTCTNCGGRVVIVGETNFCPNSSADMRSEKEYLDKTFPEHDGGEWLDITDMMTKESEE